MTALRKLLPLVVMIAAGCAQIVAPTGGPKDDLPPKILSEEPANLSTNFASKSIVISFDEFIQLNNPAEQILISPPMFRSPTYSLTKKSLVVKFTGGLAKNTTYTINFGEAIKDNNEGNILGNYTYVFSTGMKLDSMELRGKLIDAISGEPVDKALIMLYKQNIDSLPLDTIPNYFTRTTPDGQFVIRHVADQPYKIFALKDENANYRFDVTNEPIAFLDELVLPNPTAGTTASDTAAQADSTSVGVKGPDLKQHFYELRMFEQADTSQFLKKAYCEHYGKLVFAYNRPITRLETAIEGMTFKRQWALKDYNETRDTITLWTTDLVPDSLNIRARTNTGRVDTVEILMKERTTELPTSKRGKGTDKKTQKFELSLKTDPPNKRAPDPGKGLQLIWSHPILNMDLSRLTLYEDSLKVKYELTTTDTALRIFDLSYNWKKGKRYDIHIADSAFSDLFGLWNDTIDLSFVGTDKEMYGKLSLQIAEEPTEQLVIELLTSSNKILRTQTVRTKELVSFDQLEPGKYNLRVVRDKNRNGKWDTGDYAKHVQPELIKIIQRDAEVRANWDLELVWNPNEPDQK